MVVGPRAGLVNETTCRANAFEVDDDEREHPGLAGDVAIVAARRTGRIDAPGVRVYARRWGVSWLGRVGTTCTCPRARAHAACKKRPAFDRSIRRIDPCIGIDPIQRRTLYVCSYVSPCQFLLWGREYIRLDARETVHTYVCVL